MKKRTRYKALISEAIDGRASCQIGKTSKIAWRFGFNCTNKKTLPTYCAFNYDFVFQDAKEKILKNRPFFGDLLLLDPREKDQTIPTRDGKMQQVGFNRLADILASKGKLVKDREYDYSSAGFIGLSNHHFLRKIDFHLGMLKDYYSTPLYLDEGDPFEIGHTKIQSYVSSRTGLKGAGAMCRVIRKMIEAQLFTEVNLISATNLGTAIGSTILDEVESIAPKTGYTNKHEYFILLQSDIDLLDSGIVSPRIKEFIDLIDNNLLINICQTLECHNRIERAFQGEEFEEWQFHKLNLENSSFDAKCMEKGKHIVAGGRKFGRGASFPRVEGLILDKRTTHATNLIQAVGRLHGYNDFTPIIACTKEQRDRLEAAYEFEAQISNVELLKLPPDIRWNAIRQIKVPNVGLKILPRKNNGWEQKNTKTGSLITF